MSFSSTVKEELSRQLTTARHCQIAEMAAILSLCGRVKISASDHFAIAIHTDNLASGPVTGPEQDLRCSSERT